MYINLLDNLDNGVMVPGLLFYPERLGMLYCPASLWTFRIQLSLYDLPAANMALTTRNHSVQPTAEQLEICDVSPMISMISSDKGLLCF
jgi:hypothetical protein